MRIHRLGGPGARAVAVLLMLLAGPLAPRAAGAQGLGWGNPLRQLLRRDTAGLGRVLAHPAAYRVQILYTRIRRDARGRAHFRRYGYRLRPREYFYPASTVKLPTAALALARLRALGPQVPGLTADSPMLTDSAFAGQTRVLRDSSSASGRPTVANYVRKALLVSDNDAYNRLYELVGPGALQAGLRQLGLRRTRIAGRLAVGDVPPGTRHTNPVSFYADTAARRLLYHQPAAYWPGPGPHWHLRGTAIGQAHVVGTAVVPGPLDLSQKNVFPLRDQQWVLRAVLFPETLPARRRLALAPADYGLLRTAMGEAPAASPHPRYDAAHYPATYAKFLLGGGGQAALPPGVQVFNKIGQSYGFLIDNAYVTDAAQGVEFLLSAVVYVNADGVLNDDRYEYDAIGFPFLRELGRRVYEAECRRKRP
ncbi:serine hydrolase [Hymenobacter nivis]|nr:serine hydrolase [Hymenobacter nivis]